VIAWQFSSRCAQQQAKHVAAHIFAADELATERAHRKLPRCEHAIPQQDAIFFGLRQAGEHFAMIMAFTTLTHPAVYQQGSADQAITITTCLRTVVAQPARSVEDQLTSLDVQHCSGGLQSYFHQ